MAVSADLVFAAPGPDSLTEIASWDAFRPATLSASEFPVDVVRFEGSHSPPVVLSRARRAESLKALPASLRERALLAFARSERRPAFLGLARGRRLDLSSSPSVMGVVNVTPDSFSDGGLYLDAGAAIAHGFELEAQGADILDIGGESTRPGAEPVDED